MWWCVEPSLAPPRAQEDARLLWIADEALQATEPVGWEERQDPDGGVYYYNTITDMAMVQNPVDYHYQQIYLQMKAAEQKGRPRPPKPKGSGADARRSSYKLDLRSVDSDDVGAGDTGTPSGWLKRTRNLLTPRSLSPSHKRQAPEFVQVARRA